METIITELIDKITSVMGSMGFISGFLLIILESMIPILPLAVFIALNIMTFGSLFGFLISWIATVIGCMISFTLCRKLRDKFEKKYGKESLYNDAIDFVLQEKYATVINDSKLIPIIQPTIDIKEINDEKLVLTFRITTKPEVKVEKYTKLGVKKGEVKVTEEEVKSRINSLLEQYADIVIKDGKIENGDTAVIDFEGFKKQVQRMIDGGVQALLVNGTTGETATITIEDEFKLLDLTLELAKGTGVKVICGAGSNDTQTALKKARYAKEKGADAILVVTPYYNKTSQRGLIQHYTTIADAVDIPMILYNVPGRTGLNISVDTVVELAKHKNIQAMKDATDNIAYAMEVLAKTADLDFDLYSGCDDNILPFMAAGGKGVISVTSNLYPEAVEKLTQSILKGNIKEAQPLAYALDPISRLLFIDVNPIMPKAALAKMGVCGEYLRLPLITTTDENKKALFDAMDEFEKLGY